MPVAASILTFCVIFGVLLVGKYAKETKTTCCGDTESEDPDKFIYGFLAKRSLHYSHRAKTKQGGLLDIHQNLSIFFNGQTGEAFGISYEDGRGVYIPAGVTNKTYNAEYHDDNYFKDPVSAKELFQIGEQMGQQFQADSISNEVSEKLADIMEALSTDYSNKCEALAIAAQVSRVTSNNFKTTLAALGDVMSESTLTPRGDFNWLCGVYRGINDFFIPFDGGLNALKEKNITLDLNTILTQDTGFHVLIYFLASLHSDFDLALLETLLNSHLNFFTLINKLAGEITHGFDGFINIVTGILSYNSGQNSRDNLAGMLRIYFNSPTSHNLEAKWYTSAQDLLVTLKKLRLDEEFKVLVQLLQDILDSCWFEGDINMSEVTKIILFVEMPGDEDAVKRVIEVVEKKVEGDK